MNRQIILVERPVGLPKESDFRLVEAPVPSPRPGEVLVRSLFLAIDPHLRVRPNAGFTHGGEPGEVTGGDVVGRIVESKDPRLGSGDMVAGTLGWQDYATAPAKFLRKVDPGVAPVSAALSVLGTPGLTAYFGLLDICRPQPGETVVISAAGDSVGCVAGQIAKIKRCRVVGIAGNSDRIHFLIHEFGFDSGFVYRYKATQDYYNLLKEHCPTGIDIYFDGVGEPLTDAAIRLLNIRARVAVYGQHGWHRAEPPAAGPRWLEQLVVRQARIEGFQVNQFADRYDEGLRQLTTWLREGRIKYHEELIEGLQNAPKALIGVLEGENAAKQVVKVAD